MTSSRFVFPVTRKLVNVQSTPLKATLFSVRLLVGEVEHREKA